MPASDPTCPVCSADIPLTGDERKGDEIFCTYCGAPCRLMVVPRKDDDEESGWGAEEDF